jgi:hypothetical protein
MNPSFAKFPTLNLHMATSSSKIKPESLIHEPSHKLKCENPLERQKNPLKRQKHIELVDIRKKSIWQVLL